MRKLIWISLLIGLLLAACAKEAEEVDPASALEPYFNAMVKNDLDKIPTLVCPDFERDARTAFRSWGANENPTIEGMKCKVSGEDESDKLVTCEGTVEYVYNGENDSLDLSTLTYRVREVDGEWKVCGYE